MTLLYTHSGDFHADELIAVALIQRFFESSVEVVRTRHPAQLEAALADASVLVVDVGRRHEPGLLNFDHHQEGGAGQWADGTPKSSCGLVWSWLRETGCLHAWPNEVLDRVEEGLIKPVDAHDNGASQWELASMFRMYNRPGASEDVVMGQFVLAQQLASQLIDNHFNQAQLNLETEKKLQSAWRNAQEYGDSVVVVTDMLGNREAPTLLARLTNFEADLMMYPQSASSKNRKWFIRALPSKEGDRQYKVTFPPSMRGKTDGVMELVDGAPTRFKFIHNSGFLALVEGTLLEVHRVAKALLDHPESRPTPPQASSARPGPKP